jgi:hypothetical protein
VFPASEARPSANDERAPSSVGAIAGVQMPRRSSRCCHRLGMNLLPHSSEAEEVVDTKEVRDDNND